MRKPWLETPTLSGGDEPFTPEQLRSMPTLHLLRLHQYDRSKCNMIPNEIRKQSGPSDQIETDAQMSVHTGGSGLVNSLDERHTTNCEDKNAGNGMGVEATGTSDDLPKSWLSSSNRFISSVMKAFKL